MWKRIELMIILHIDLRTLTHIDVCTKFPQRKNERGRERESVLRELEPAMIQKLRNFLSFYSKKFDRVKL